MQWKPLPGVETRIAPCDILPTQTLETGLLPPQTALPAVQQTSYQLS